MVDTAQWKLATTQAGCADRSDRGTVVASGTEVVPLLQGVVTSDVFALADEGSGQLSAATNANGRLVCDLRFLHAPDLLLMDFEPGIVRDVISHFRANVMMEDARFTDRSAATGRLCLLGPKAAQVLDGAASLARRVDALAPYHGTWGTLAGHDVIVQRIPTYGVSAWDLYLAAEAASEIRDHLELPAIDADTLETLRIEAGVPRWGAELDTKIIPIEADLNEAVSYDKGCYVGQEIIARLDTLGRPAKLLRMLLLEGESPDAVNQGTSVVRDGKSVGEVRSATWSPRHERTIALAYLKRDHYDLGTVVEVADRQAVVRPLKSG